MMTERRKYNFPVLIDLEDGRPPWVIEAEYLRKHGHGFVLAPVPDCEACNKPDDEGPVAA